ncbi:hypothetical protein H3S88_12675 [Gilliamella sp. B14448G11]|uniref:hypothetical protein n=2 Tax=Gilliamella TaxID=1193503 RepID=UPI0018DE47CA|nr:MULTISPECIES: hypothetical protein [unclassified Gilliamella]MBI0036515.1 hypothetical protein [Gilliamella sp. B14448G11]MBI0043691.1 hypothetical protein [Gilliamella sp. B14448G12]
MKSFFMDSNNHPEIILIKKSQKAVIFYVKNGKGLLCEKYGYTSDLGFRSLFFNDIPLIKFYGDEYMCPTCNRLISAGYGLDQSDKNKKVLSQLNNVLNAPFINLEQSLNDLKPLLGLLPSGYYQLSDEELFPTNGDGKFFWCIDNTQVINYASSGFWNYEDFNFSILQPKYLLPSQSPYRLNMDRVKYYQGETNTRAISYFHTEGYLCTLIDGHHKATAAALNKRPVNTLVISQSTIIVMPNKELGEKGKIQFTHLELLENELLTSFDKTMSEISFQKLDKTELENTLNLKNAEFDDYQWSDELIKTAENYYDASIFISFNFAGEITNERLNNILSGRDIVSNSMLEHIINVLFITKHEMAVIFSISIFKNGLYNEIWSSIFTQLSKYRCTQVSDFFLEFLINDNNERPWLTKIVDHYFE